jgi:hypothetical protein
MPITGGGLFDRATFGIGTEPVLAYCTTVDMSPAKMADLTTCARDDLHAVCKQILGMRTADWRKSSIVSFLYRSIVF